MQCSGSARQPSSLFLADHSATKRSRIRARHARWFPEIGYDSYEGAWIKIQIPFGKDQYYYGYYIVNYFTKEGLGLGYVGFYSSKRGRRSVSLNLYTINDQLQGGRQTNLALRRTREYFAAPEKQLSVFVPIELRAAREHPPQRDDGRIHRAPNHANVAELQLHPQLRRVDNPAAIASRSPIRASSTRT